MPCLTEEQKKFQKRINLCLIYNAPVCKRDRKQGTHERQHLTYTGSDEICLWGGMHVDYEYENFLNALQQIFESSFDDLRSHWTSPTSVTLFRCVGWLWVHNSHHKASIKELSLQGLTRPLRAFSLKPSRSTFKEMEVTGGMGKGPCKGLPKLQGPCHGEIMHHF